MTTTSDILHHLKFHHAGQQRAVSAKALAEYFGIRERGVRELIAELRRQRIPICSIHEGYYWPLSRKDAAPGITFITQMFQQLRAANDGFFAGLEDEFGQDQLPLEAAV